MEMIGATSQDSAEIIKAGYKTKLSGLDENLILNDYAGFAIEFANRLIAINPDIEIWYSFPDIHIATLAELYIEPFLEYYEKLKNDTDAQVWEKNIKGMYWVREDVPAKTYDVFNTQNLVDFDNKTVKAMKACTDAVHKDDKLTFWCPYYRPIRGYRTSYRIYSQSNRTSLIMSYFSPIICLKTD